MNAILRKPTLADATSLAQLACQLGYQTEVGQMQKRLEVIFGDASHFVVVATVQEKLVGWIHAFVAHRLESDAFVEIGGMVVDENFRNKGIGKLLVAEVGVWSREKRASSVRVRSNIIRKEAHEFYLKLGFLQKKEQAVFEKIIALQI